MNPTSTTQFSSSTPSFSSSVSSLFMNALNFAKSNPNSPASLELMNRIKGGQFNDQLKSIGVDTTKFVPPTTAVTPASQQGTPSSFGDVGTAVKSTGTDIASGFKSAQTSMSDVAERALTGKQNWGETILQGLGVGAKLGNDIIGSGLKALVNLNVPQPVQDAIGGAVSSVIQSSPILKAGLDAAKGGMDNFNEWAKTNPKDAATISALVNIPLFAAQFVGIGEAGKVVKPLEEAVGTATEGIKTAVTGAKEAITGKVGGIAESLKGKTMEEILATPESQVAKLSPAERQVYFDNAKTQITQKSSDVEAQIKADLATKTQQAQTEAEALQRKVAVASRDETVALRPQIRTALANQSATYRQLVSEEIAQHADTPVSATELKQFVDSRFANNPGMADAVNGKLGLSGETVAPPLKLGELPTTQLGEPIAHGGKFNPSQADTTIGKLYEQTKALKGEIGTAATKGTRVYTVDEKLTDDAISTLSDFMKSKGVDLKQANSFWAKYAPVRNQLVSEAKPFLQTGIQTKTFAGTLVRVAKGIDINNENFIKSVEDILGQPIGTQTKNAVAELTQNEKVQIANEIQADTKIMENKLLKETQLKNLSDKQFEIERQARGREIVIKVLKGAGLVTGGILGEETIRRVL